MLDDRIHIIFLFSDVVDKKSEQRLSTTIQFSVAFDPSRSTLIISVASVADLHAKAMCCSQTATGHSQPRSSPASRGAHVRLEAYVRLGLHLPDGRRFKAKTRVVSVFSGRGDLAPSLTGIDYGETFAFRGVKSAQLTNEARIHLALLTFDRFSRDSVIGDVTVSFDERELRETMESRDEGSAAGGVRSGSRREGWSNCGLKTATMTRQLELKVG